MIYSMTGFGKATADLTDKIINIEIKSLNSKSIDISARIAPVYREKESEIRQLLAAALSRGKIDFNLWIEHKQAATTVPPINEEVIETYYHQIKKIATSKGIPTPSDWFSTLLKMPEVFTKNETFKLDEDEWLIVQDTIKQAIDHLLEFRKQEGEGLTDQFNNNINKIEELLQLIPPFEEERVRKIRERLTEALEDNSLIIEYDQGRLEQELIYYIEKLDVTEEKQRLLHHLNYFKSTMNAPTSQGKKLGFISQEIGREINTLGSKSNDADMQRIVVQMKDELEQIKEQTFNVL